MDTQKTKRREWVKSAAIIFLTILLILTFFSNTIMNRSLPEVAAKYVESGAINARIRGTGTVSANEVYHVTIPQTKKVRSVLVKTGDVVAAGDVLFRLEAADSAELQEAQKQLEAMELAYQKRLIEQGNADSSENREVQKLQNAYNDAMAAFRLYSNEDPSQVKISAENAKAELNRLQLALKDEQSALNSVSASYNDANSRVSELTGKLTDAENDLRETQEELSALISAEEAWNQAVNVKNRDWIIYGDKYTALKEFATVDGVTDYTLLAAYGQEPTLFDNSLSEDAVQDYRTAYSTIEKNAQTVKIAEQSLETMLRGASISDRKEALNLAISYQESDVAALEKAIELGKGSAESLSTQMKRYERFVEAAQEAVDAQQAVLSRYESAVSAAQTLEAAKEALDDKMFSISLGSTESLDMKAEKEAIEKQKDLVAQLSDSEGGLEVTANVSGTVTEISCSAGTTVGADTPMATITVTDRGYTLKLSVTTEQARKVQPGDTAMISNYYSSDVTATLETVANDPQSLGKNKFLIFRLTGDVEPGASMTLSIGQKSANYDCLIPNSAVRTDANGTYVLAVEAKSSPLGNRYVAVRADVTVLASDDTSSAVSGLSNGDFVITTSTRPIEAGDQVRMVDGG